MSQTVFPTLLVLQYDAWQTAEDKGWHDVGHTFGDRIALVHSEASEALEAFRDRGDPTATWVSEKGSPKGVPSELADIVIRCLDIAGCYGIDLETAVVEKMAFNRTRPYRHGGKKL